MIPTRMDELRDQALAWMAALGEPISPQEALPVSKAGIYMTSPCPLCNRDVPVFSLSCARKVPQVPAEYACGACRERLVREGGVGTAEWARAYGAPPGLLLKLEKKDNLLRGK